MSAFRQPEALIALFGKSFSRSKPFLDARAWSRSQFKWLRALKCEFQLFIRIGDSCTAPFSSRFPLLAFSAW